jgi:DNA-binding response OmpR family regulator
MAGERVLVIDDSPSVRLQLESVLGAAGYAVRSIAGADNALQECLAWQPQLVLLDVRMPGVDGHQAAIDIKFDDRLKDTPLLFLSADSSEESRSVGLGHGAEGYLIKPCAPEALLSKVGAILRPLGEIADGPDLDKVEE